MEPDEGVVLTVVSGPPEADLLCGLLQSNGIDCAYRDAEEIDSPMRTSSPPGGRRSSYVPEIWSARALLANPQYAGHVRLDEKGNERWPASKHAISFTDETPTPAEDAGGRRPHERGATVARFTFEPGWRWSECVKPVSRTRRAARCGASASSARGASA